MKQQLTVGTFRNDICGCDNLCVTKCDPFSPVGIKAIFKKIIVNNSASPYIILQNDGTELCISHIKSILKHHKNGSGAVYVLTCEDYSLYGSPFDMTLKIET